jgi:hypothetical protein
MVKYRIDNAEEAGLIIFAILFDIISIFPGADDLITPVAEGLLAFFFLINGVNPLGKKTALVFGLSFIGEMIPFVSIFPFLTIETIYIIHVSREEDDERAKKAAASAPAR